MRGMNTLNHDCEDAPIIFNPPNSRVKITPILTNIFNRYFMSSNIIQQLRPSHPNMPVP